MPSALRSGQNHLGAFVRLSSYSRRQFPGQPSLPHDAEVPEMTTISVSLLSGAPFTG
jgi:hypothetical protein